MPISSYHLVKLPLRMAIRGLFVNLLDRNTAGLVFSKYMTSMTLGSPIISRSRFLIQEVAVFAQWESEQDLENYLEKTKFGNLLKNGWYLRLGFMRNWGKISGYKIPAEQHTLADTNPAVVAVTIAKMKPFAIPRFLHWGRPVEKLVRDHAGTTIAMAAFSFPNTVATFSIWENEKEMTNMVHGHSKMPKPKRHSKAMKERERKPFHFEFTTLRFKPLSEHGSWKGKSNYTQNLTVF